MVADKKHFWLKRVLFGILVSVVSIGLAQAGVKETQQTLYGRLGGLMPISVVVDDFLDAMVPDPFLNQNPEIAKARERVPRPYLKYRVTSFVCQAAGGPCQYSGRSMKESHDHLNITEAEWDRMVVIFKEVMDEHQIPGPEQRDLLELIATTRADIVTAETGE
jgi:hemoglobin